LPGWGVDLLSKVVLGIEPCAGHTGSRGGGGDGDGLAPVFDFLQRFRGAG
jgi:hypothetical protein